MAEIDGLGVVLGNLARYEANMRRALYDAAEEIAVLLENHAKANHPWRDKSGFTTASTLGQIAEETQEFVIVALSAGMDYDVFLELAREGRWSWLWPTVEAKEADIKSILARHLGSVGI